MRRGWRRAEKRRVERKLKLTFDDLGPAHSKGSEESRKLTRKIDEREVESRRSRYLEDNDVLSKAVLLLRTERGDSRLDLLQVEREKLVRGNGRVENGELSFSKHLLDGLGIVDDLSERNLDLIAMDSSTSLVVDFSSDLDLTAPDSLDGLDHSTLHRAPGKTKTKLA